MTELLYPDIFNYEVSSNDHSRMINKNDEIIKLYCMKKTFELKIELNITSLS